MGTTKLTRKEILAEDPVHVAMIQLIEFFKVQGTNVALGAAGALVLAAAIYFGMQYLDARGAQAQQDFGKGLDLYHAQIDAAASDDPYAKGANPVFKNETAKYQSALKSFSSVSSKYGFSKLAVLARYYQGLCQLELGQKDDAVKSFEAVRNNTKDRTTGFLARKVLADIYLKAGNPKGAQEVLESMIADPQCQIPQDDLKLQLAQVYAAEGKREQAIKILRDARDQAQQNRSMLSGQIAKVLQKLESSGPPVPVEKAPVQTPPAVPPR